MNWYKQKTKTIFCKTASKAEIRDRAINALQLGADANQVINQFINEMSTEDPTFQGGTFLGMTGDMPGLIHSLQTMDVSETPAPTQVDVQRAEAPPEEVIEPDGKEGEQGAADEGCNNGADGAA